MGQKDKRVSIFEYKDYRLFLKDLYESKKKKAERLTFRHFARIAGFSSPSFLKLVMDGKRNISPESIAKFAAALELNQEEAEFFTNLVHLNQAVNTDQKRFHAGRILKSRTFRERNPSSSLQYEYFAKWYHVPIRELVATDDFKEDPSWISKRFDPPLPPGAAERALERLIELGMLKRDKRGKLVQSDRVVATGDDLQSASLAQFHREMIQRGADAIDRRETKQREISSLTFGTSPEIAEDIKSLVRNFKKEMIALLLKGKESSQVYQLNFQFFPLTALEDDEESKDEK